MSSSLHLYDANDQDLGILVSSDNGFNSSLVYLPGIEGLFAFKQSIGINPSSFNVGWAFQDTSIYFDNDDCTGKSYVRAAYDIPNNIIKLRKSNRFFKVTDELSQLPHATQSFWGADSARCTNTQVSEIWLRVEEVTLPFSYPPVGPLKVKLIN